MQGPEPSDSDTPPEAEAEAEPTAAPCRFLRNKGMYVYTDGSGGEGHEGYDNSIYWCFQTMNSFGPDEDFVSRDECRCVTRTCYQPV